METTLDDHKKHILLVEDDEFISDVYTTKLSREGFEVDRAENGEVALKKAREHKPNLILLDLMMPIKDGFETLRELKLDTLLKDIKVIVLSNLSQPEDKEKVKNLGADDYCVKAESSFQEMIGKVKTNLGVA